MAFLVVSVRLSENTYSFWYLKYSKLVIIATCLLLLAKFSVTVFINTSNFSSNNH